MSPRFNCKCNCSDRLYCEGELTEDDEKECWDFCQETVRESVRRYKPVYNMLFQLEKELKQREKKEFIDQITSDLLKSTEVEIADMLTAWEKEVDDAYAIFESHHPGKREMTDCEDLQPTIRYTEK